MASDTRTPEYTALIGLVTVAFVLFALPPWSWEDGRFDSMVDAAIAVAIFVTSSLLLLSQLFNQEAVSMLSLALVVSGILRFFGSTLDVENEFVWVHRFCSLSFGVALFLDPIQVQGIWRKLRTVLFLTALTVVLALGTAITFKFNILPRAVEYHWATQDLIVTSFLAAALFYGGAWLRWGSRRKRQDVPFMVCCLFLGLTALLYPFFPIWSSQWWAFQIIELGINFYLAIALFIVHYQQLKATREQLQQHAGMMERTLALVSHDIRNPLNVASMGAQVLQSSPTISDADRLIAVKMTRNLKHIDSMIQSLLDVVLVSSGKGLPLKLERRDLCEAIHRMTELQLPEQASRMKIAACTPIWGDWDIDGIQRALENLVANAFKYGDPLGQVDIQLVREGDLALLSVHNRGGEIPPTEKENVFSPFHRLLNRGKPIG